MAAGDQPAYALPKEACQAFSDACGGEVDWRTDGGKRCERHQGIYERSRRKQRLLSWTVAALIVVAAAVVVNALIRPEQGPSQAQAWDICHEYAAATLEISPGTRFAELPANPSERVKVILASDLYRVFSYYVLPDLTRRDFLCTVRYLGNDEWEVAGIAVAP